MTRRRADGHVRAPEADRPAAGPRSSSAGLAVTVAAAARAVAPGLAPRRLHDRSTAATPCWPASSSASLNAVVWPALAVRRRADLGAHARARRHRARRAGRRRWCSTGCPASSSTASGPPSSSSSAWRSSRRSSSSLLALDDDAWFDQRMAAPGPAPRPRARRRPTSPASCSCRSTASPRSVLRPGAALRRRPRRSTAGCATAPTASSAGRRGGRRRPASASAASCTARSSTCRRSAGSTRRPATIVVSNRPAVGGRHRARPLRRPRPARPPRFELRQPVLRRRRAGRADDERRRQAQGGSRRRRLRRLLLPARSRRPGR